MQIPKAPSPRALQPATPGALARSDARITADMQRRQLVTLAIASLTLGHAMARKAGAQGLPLRLGVDRALVDSGLADALRLAFGRETGIVVQLVPAPALEVLAALSQGEVDAALTNAPDAEAKLEQEGLLHDRQLLGASEFVLIGPVATAPPRSVVPRAAAGSTPGRATTPAPIAAAPPAIVVPHDAVATLVHLRDAAVAEPGKTLFLSAGDGSGAHVAEQALWRSAQIAPAAPWYATATQPTRLIAEARVRGAYAVVERGAWVAAQGGAPLGIVVDGDARLAESVRVMRAFQVTHPAGKIFVGWLAGGRGQAVMRSRGYRAAAAPARRIMTIKLLSLNVGPGANDSRSTTAR